MLNNTDVFENSNLKSIWFDLQGLLRSWVRVEQGKPRTRRKSPFSALIASAAIGIASTAHAMAEPVQLTLMWPMERSAAATKHALMESIKGLRRIEVKGIGYSSPAPVERSVNIAQWIVPQFPDVIADAQAGVNGDGNVFVRFSQGEKVAYITVEPKAMHLLVMEPGQPNVYIDDEQFGGKIVPDSIKRILAERFRS